MASNRNCRNCGKPISLRKMPNGKWIPFDRGYGSPQHNCKKRPSSGGKGRSAKKTASASSKAASKPDRPYKNLRTVELRKIFEAKAAGIKTLKAVRAELSLRKSKKAKRFLVRVEERIDQLSKEKARVAKTGKKSQKVPAAGSKDGSLSRQRRRPSPPAKSPNPVPRISPIETIPGDQECSFRPWIFGLLIGRPRTIVKRVGDELHITHRGEKSPPIPLVEITEIKIKRGFLSTSVELSRGVGDATRLRFEGIAFREKNRLIRGFFECRFSKEIKQARVEFNELLEKPGYVTSRATQRWKDRYSAAISSVKTIPDSVNDSKHADSIGEWKTFVASWKDNLRCRNDEYVDSLSQQWRSYFDDLESNPLTDAQVEAVLRDDDFTLVVAGAGTGKTSAVVGKIGFLIESGEVAADDVLALAYGSDAAEEMRERVADRTGHEVEIRTYHSLGLHIVTQHRGVRQRVADTAKDDRAFNARIARLLMELFEEDKTGQLVIDFVVHHRHPAKYLEDFDHQADYFVYLRKKEPRTLKGELVKSFEELLIADWLCLNGVEYKYEHPYEHKTGSRKRFQYKPDFYLCDYGIYLEHFGIGKDGSTAPGIDQAKYHEGIEWKRGLHEQHGTVLVETYSWERQQGNLLELLKVKLEEAGVKISPMDKEQIGKLIRQREVNKPLVALLQRFLNIFRQGLWEKDELLEKANSLRGSERKRAGSFLKLFFALSRKYVAWLSEHQEVDFADMIKQAVKLLEAGEVRMPFKRIVVDEYQDISRGLYRLFKALLRQTDDTRMLCVGDDWQSIYGFTGSDIRMTTEFDSRFGAHTRVDLDQTFRFSQPIMDASANFIQKNKGQLSKDISARPATLSKSIELISVSSRDAEGLRAILACIDADRPPGDEWTVLLLGRYRFVEESAILNEVMSEFEKLDVEFMTIHKSKGREADAVAVLELKTARYGFPSEIEDDQLLELILPANETFPHAEERRVLYVAMTRARSKVVLVADPSSPSEFVEELQSCPEVYTAGKGLQSGRFPCPSCKKGWLMLTNPNRKNGYAWKCSLRPYCSHEAKYCYKCMNAPEKSEEGEQWKCLGGCDQPNDSLDQ